MLNQLHRLGATVAALLLVFSLLPTPTQAVAPQWETLPPIRVAFVEQEGLLQRDDQGRYSGYTYEYLQEFSQYTGLEYEFVPVAGDLNTALSNSLAMLERGEVDLLGGVVKNDYTARTFDLPEYGYGYSYTTLLLPEDNTRINEANFQEIVPLRIACLSTATATQEKLDAFCQINNVSYELVACDDEPALVSALQTGRADLRVGSSLAPIAGLRTIAQFNGVPFYFAVTKGNTQLLQSLNRGTLSLKQAKPYFESDLYDRYFSSSPDRLYFTQEEEDYLQDAPLLRVALPAVVPIQGADKGGDAWGMAVDYLRRIGQDVGLEFTFLPTENFQQALAMLHDGQADLVSGIPYSYTLAQEHGLLMSSPFLTAQGVTVLHPDQTAQSRGGSVAVIDRLAQDALPNVNGTVISYSTIQQCLDAVLDGDAGGAYLSLYAAEYWGNTQAYRDLRLIPSTGNTVSYCFGAKKEIQPELISILNKAIRSFPTTSLETLVQQNMSRNETHITLQAFIEANPLLTVTGISLLFIVLLAGGGWILLSRVRNGARFAVENQRYQRLYELANEYIYEYDCQRDLLTLSSQFAQHFGLPEHLPQFSRRLAGLEDGVPIRPDGLDILLALRRRGANSDIQLRLPSGDWRWYRNTSTKIDGDYGKPRYFLGKLVDVQEEVEERERLELQLQLDGLTGLYNAVSAKGIIGERLAQLSGQAALLMLDIDHFKQINDQLGHYTGDIVLRDLAALLQDVAGAQDILGRLGGDEFMVYLGGISSAKDVEAFCHTLCQRARRVYTGADGVSIPVSISVGAALINRPCDFTQLYQMADKLLYSSKAAGRDRYTISPIESR